MNRFDEIYNWLPEWGKEKFHNCPIFYNVIMAAYYRRLEKEQILWLLCETIYKDRDTWKRMAMEWISANGQPPTIGNQIVK